MESVIDFSHSLFNTYITKEDVVIDMTIGNGNDTIYLASIAKFVYGFDIQQYACNKTLDALKGFNNYKIINDSHLNFDKYINEDFSGVIFNLGYLPKGNKEITTDAFVVLETLKKVLSKIKKNGICVIVFYPGHKSGLEEANIIGEYLRELNQKEFDVLKYEFVNQTNNPPFLTAIKKRI